MSSTRKKGILGFGTLIVDDCVCVPENFLHDSGVPVGGSPGSYPEFVRKFLANYKSTFRGFGGSMANVIKGISMLGYRTGLAGVCSDDEEGKVIMDGVKEHNIESLVVVKPGHDSSRVVVCVHPSSQRTMFGVFDEELKLTIPDVNWDEVAKFDCVAFDGYFMKEWDHAELCDRIYKSSRDNDQRVLVVLSDIFWAGRYKERAWEAAYKSLLISGTEDEFKQLFDIYDRNKLLDFLRNMDYDICAVTMGAEGAYVIQKDQMVFIPVEAGVNAVDTVGAGDYFAAGMFYAHFQGYDMAVCGKVGAMFAASVVSKLGNLPDPEVIERIHAYLSTQKKVDSVDQSVII